jgi:hypothetical protein
MAEFFAMSIMDRLLTSADSTTLYLESLRKEKLMVVIESQTLVYENNIQVIKRVVKLFFDTPEQPLLYCISRLNKSVLSKIEMTQLLDDVLPIGKVFTTLNDPQTIFKTNICVSQRVDHGLKDILNVESELIFKKQYDYEVGNRKIGQIIEYFNEESLKRI